MKSGWWIWTSTVLLLALLGPEAEAGSTLRDLSGNAMQSNDSRMMSAALSSTPRGYSSKPPDLSGKAMQSYDSRMRWSAGSSTPRDSSGDALQRDRSRMMSSPVMPFLGQFGTPYYSTYYSTSIVYPRARSRASVKVQGQITDAVPTPSPTPLAGPQFWIARCGDFLALDASSTMNLMEEEQKPCSR